MPEEPSSKTLWRKALEIVTVRIKRTLPLSGWAFIALVLYIFVGASVFPGWWKRFLLAGGLFDRRFWLVAFAFFGDALRAGHPMGLVTVALACILTAWVIFTMGRVGPRQLLTSVRPPRIGIIVVAGVVLLLTLVGLATFPDEYKTPDEVHAALEESIKRADEISLRSFSYYLSPRPPASGFFLYLDGAKVSKTYNALQKDLTLASETTTHEGAAEKHAKIDLHSVSGELIDRDRIEKSVQMIPAAPTPERQARWLIDSYHNLNLAIELNPTAGDDPESFDARLAQDSLAERGVVLTPQQLDTLRLGDAKVLSAKLERPNAPVLYAGKIHLKNEGQLFRVTLKTGGGAVVTVSGTGPLDGLDDNILSCVRQTSGCELSASLLAIAWRSRQSGRSIDLDIVPLAIW